MVLLEQGELALTIMGVDGNITPEVVAKLQALSVRCLLYAVVYRAPYVLYDAKRGLNVAA